MTKHDETIEREAREWAEKQSQFCRCAGYTCSGCEKETLRFAENDFLAGAEATRAKAEKLVESLKEAKDALLALVPSDDSLGDVALRTSNRISAILKDWEGQK